MDNSFTSDEVIGTTTPERKIVSPCLIFPDEGEFANSTPPDDEGKDYTVQHVEYFDRFVVYLMVDT